MEVEKKYNKILIAKHSPENRCNVHDGEALVLRPKLNVPLKDHIPHFFVSANDGKTKSKYGWVKIVKEFELNDFIDKYINFEVSTADITSIKNMLDSIVNYTEDSPVAATYSQKCFNGKEMKLSVHKIIFYLK